MIGYDAWLTRTPDDGQECTERRVCPDADDDEEYEVDVVHYPYASTWECPRCGKVHEVD